MRNYREIIEKQLGRSLRRHEVVHHKDGNRNNNNNDNLKLMSLSEHSSLHMSGRALPETTKLKLQKQSRKRRPGAKLLETDIPIIRKMFKDGIKQRLIAFAYDVGLGTVRDICQGRSWAWV